MYEKTSNRFHVKGTSAQDVVGVQTEEKAMSLNSMDCFVLVAPTAVYCWQGNGATDAEKESSVKIAELLKVGLTLKMTISDDSVRPSFYFLIRVLFF